jgi:glycosyltransferase involved in cell wall biosynthesis
MSITLCLLTLNELKGCQIDVPKIKLSDFDEVFVIDGGSKDGTVEYLEQNGLRVYPQKKRGLNAAHWEAIHNCQTDYLISYHPKGTTSYEDTLKLKKAMENDGYDFVVASRNIANGYNEEDSGLLKPRKWFVTCLAILTALRWCREGNRIWDVLHGFRGVRKSVFLRMNPPQDGFTIDLAMVIEAYKKRIKRLEIPTTELPRLYGETHFKAIPTGIELLKYLFKEMLSRST